MSVLILSENGKLVPKPSLAAAIADADCAGKTVVITGNVPIAADVTTLGGIGGIKIESGGLFTIAAGATLTIDVPFNCGLMQCFSLADDTAGVVFESGSVSEVYPEWWGAKGTYDGSTGLAIDGTAAVDCTEAIQAAIDTLFPVKFAPTGEGAYYIPESNSLYLPDTVSHPNKATKLFGDNSNVNASGAKGQTNITFGGGSLFKSKTTPAGSGLTPSVKIIMSGLHIHAKYGTSSNCFDTMVLNESYIYENVFSGFGRVLYGTLGGVTVFTRNKLTGVTIAGIARNTAYTSVSVDSTISDNYFTGNATLSTSVTLLDIYGSTAMTVDNNYFDFAARGIRIGGGDNMSSITNNTFDILYIAINIEYGGKDISISNNNFMRLKTTSSSYFTTPLAEMSNPWMGIYFDQNVKDVAVIGNRIQNCDRFMILPSKWYKNIKEWGNVGTTGFTSPVVYMGTRVVDESGYVGIGQSGDGTLFNFESMEFKDFTSVPNPVTGSYENHSFFIYHALITNHNGIFLDTSGGRFFGRENLSPAAPLTDFSGGWVASGGTTFPGGVLTCIAPTGWTYTGALGSPLAEGMYIVQFRVATYTGPAYSYVVAGLRLDDGTNAVGDVAGYSVGTFYNTIVVPAGKTATKLAMFSDNPFLGTVDDYFIIKIQ